MSKPYAKSEADMACDALSLHFGIEFSPVPHYANNILYSTKHDIMLTDAEVKSLANGAPVIDVLGKRDTHRRFIDPHIPGENGISPP